MAVEITRRRVLQLAAMSVGGQGLRNTSFLSSNQLSENSQNSEQQEGKYIAPFIFSRGDPNKPYAFFTLDDGYVRGEAAAIADSADRVGAKVTFLPVVSVVQQDPYFWRDVVSRGHGISNHTVNHPYLTRLSYQNKVNEIVGARNYLEDLLGIAVTIMRPPFGQYDQDVRNICYQNGIKIMTGTVDSLGYTTGVENTARSTNIAYSSASRGVISGGIMVMHMIPSDRNAIPYLFQLAAERGLTSESVTNKIA